MAINSKRIYGVLIFICTVFGFLTLRIIQIQFLNREKLKVIADSQYSYKENISEINYLLLDTNGKELLDYNNKYFLVIDTLAFKRNNGTTDIKNIYALNYILKNYNKKYDLSDIIEKPKSAKLYFTLDEETYNKIKSMKDIKGIYLYRYSEVDRKEAWKIENILSDTKNTKNDSSLEGIIHSKTKGNKAPSITFHRDVSGNVDQGLFNIPDKNVNIRLTLDKDIQDKVRYILNQDKYKKYEEIGVVLVESKSGKIRALAQKDEKKPNILLGSATENGYVPGSIFKLVVEGAALDQEAVSLNDRFSCKLGKYSLCKKPHGNLTVEEALILSCNNVFAQIGKKVGWDTILDYAKKQGLFDKVLNLNGDYEVKGDYAEPKIYEDGPLFLSMGQNMRITPLQAASIVNTIVNHGVYIKPTILEAFVDINNNTLEELSNENKQVLKKSTADILKNDMIKVVRDEKGTGKSAYISTIETGGKTGTTTRMEPKKTGNSIYSTEMEKHSDGWFLGFFKHKGEYFSLVIFIKDINEDNQAGGSTAAPIFKEIVENIVNN